MKKISVFAAFHYDVAFQNTFEGYMPKCLDIIDGALDLLDEFSDYVFCIEQIILVDAYWQRRPENRERLKKHAQDRRLIFCPGMWIMPDGNIPSAESCYQNALLGRKWLQEHLEVEPGPICWMADIFGHHAQSPQIYKQLGYDMYMFERGQLENEDVVDFLWQGIDGTTILTHWEADTYYGLNIGLCWIGNRSDEWIAERIKQNVVDPLKKTSASNLLSKIGGDFIVPQRSSLKYIERWNENGWGHRIEFARPDKYIEEIRHLSSLRTISADLNPLFQGTYSSRIRLKQFNRSLQSIAYAQEALAVCLRQDTESDERWRHIVTQQFHDIICGSICDVAWKESVATYEAVQAQAENVLTQQLRDKGGDDTIIFNPLPYKRTEVVDLPDGPQALIMDAMEITSANHTSKAQGLPPVCTDQNTLDNGLLRVEVDELGRVKKLIDLTAGNVFEDSRFGFIHDIFREPDYGDPWVVHTGPVNHSLLHVAPYHDPVMKSEMEVIKHGPHFTRGADSQCWNLPAIGTSVAKNGCRVTLTAKHEEGYAVRYTLHAGEKLLRIRVEHRYVTGRQRLRAVIPTGIHGGFIRREIPAGWIEQDEGEFAAQDWTDYTGADKGLCVLNHGLPGNNVTDGVMMLALFRSVTLVERGVMPDYEDDVEQVAEYALHPFRPGDETYNPSRLGRCFNQPPVVVTNGVVPGHDGLRIHLQSDSAEIIALRPAGDAREVEVRMHDASGRDSTVKLRSSIPLEHARKITPMGTVLDDVKLANRLEVCLHLLPFEIVTLLLRTRAE